MNNNINDKLACSTLELVEKSIEELNKKNADLEDKLKDAQNNDELVKEYESN